MASSLASLSQNDPVKVRVMNPFAQDKTIKDGEVMGWASMFDSVIPLFSEEKRVSENAEAVRHVPVKDKGDVDSLFARGFPEHVELCPEDSVTVPPHLTDIFQRSTIDISPEVCDQVAMVLVIPFQNMMMISAVLI